jgi:hypothetical protein
VTVKIQQTNLPEEVALCQQLLIDVFHQELNLFGMKIPDSYDPFSIYLQIIDLRITVGTYRIVMPNSSLGLPIEEVGFDLGQFSGESICEMSRLALVKEKRGTIPFHKIIGSTCKIAAENKMSLVVAAILPRNVRLFKRYGFSQVGHPLNDPSVESATVEESVIVPMQIRV